MAGPDGERSGVQVMQLRVMSAEKLLAGDATPLHKFELGTALPEGFTFLTRRPLPVRQLVLHGRLQHLPLRARHGEARGAEQRGGRLFPADAARRQAAARLPLRGRGVRAGDDRAPAHRRPQRDPLPRRGDRHDAPASCSCGARARRARWTTRPASVARAPYHPQREMSLESLVPIVEGYKDSVAFGAFARFSDPIGFDNLNLTASYSPDDELESDERLHASLIYRHYLLDGGPALESRPISSTCSVRPSAAARGTAASFRYEHPLLYEPPETLSLVAKVAYFGELDTLPGFQNVAVPDRPARRGGDRARSTSSRAPPSAASMTRPASCGRCSPTPTMPKATSRRACSARSTSAGRCRFDHTSLWIRTGAGVASGERRRPAGQRVLRRVPQQLRRQRRGPALSRTAQHAGVRDRRAERPFLRRRACSN